jgi:hypothetical protein
MTEQVEKEWDRSIRSEPYSEAFLYDARAEGWIMAKMMHVNGQYHYWFRNKNFQKNKTSK